MTMHDINQGVTGKSKIKETKTSINHDAIRMLEEAIELVKSGEVVSIAASWVTYDNGIGGDTSSGKDKVLLWAALEHSAKQFYKDIVVQED